MYCPVEDLLKHDVQYDSYGEHYADCLSRTVQQPSSLTGNEKQAEQKKRVARFRISQATAYT
jgi:hypothetical protein